jgi:hypothetical protein
MIEADEFYCGNGNGNKMNLRVEILENLLSASGDGTSAKVNSLRQAINRCKSDMADTLGSSLDLLRQVCAIFMNNDIIVVFPGFSRGTNARNSSSYRSTYTDNLLTGFGEFTSERICEFL